MIISIACIIVFVLNLSNPNVSSTTFTDPTSSGSITDLLTTTTTVAVYGGSGTTEKSFYDIANAAGTDKVAGVTKLPICLANDSSCTRPSCVREECRPWGHFYHTMYQSRLGKFTVPNTEPFQFLEIGYVSYYKTILIHSFDFFHDTLTFGCGFSVQR
jgi:hypothetical protein